MVPVLFFFHLVLGNFKVFLETLRGFGKLEGVLGNFSGFGNVNGFWET